MSSPVSPRSPIRAGYIDPVWSRQAASVDWAIGRRSVVWVELRGIARIDLIKIVRLHYSLRDRRRNGGPGGRNRGVEVDLGWNRIFDRGRLRSLDGPPRPRGVA